MQTGAAAINRAMTENSKIGQSIDEKRADQAAEAKKQALNNEAQKVEADIKNMNTEGLSEGVQAGINEASSELANKIRESLQQGKLKMEGLERVMADLTAIKHKVAQESGNGDNYGGQELINALKELSQKLDKLQ